MSSEISFSHELTRILTKEGFIADFAGFRGFLGLRGDGSVSGGDGEWLLA